MALAKYKISEMATFVVLPNFHVLVGFHIIFHSAIPEDHLGQGKVGSTS